MRHHAFAAAMGLMALAVIAPVSQSQAASADPTGIWQKSEQGERPGKMEIFRCGTGSKLLCAKIVWLQDPLDSRGRPLQDVRNENPALRDRPIMGLPIFSGLTPTAPATWSGKIYNPEDGNTYSATLTLVSRSQINLKGCKAWLLCGERTWVKTSLPKTEPKPEEQIEASAEPEAAPSESAKAEAQKAEPKEAQPQEQQEQDEGSSPQEVAVDEAEMLTPAPPPSDQEVHPGYRFLNASAEANAPENLSGESVPSMFAVNSPIETESTPASSGTPDGDVPDDNPSGSETSTAATGAPVPTPEPKPGAPKRTMQASAVPGAPVPQTDPSSNPAPDSAEAAGNQEADETAAVQEPLTWRERRLLRRQQKQQRMLPWLR